MALYADYEDFEDAMEELDEDEWDEWDENNQPIVLAVRFESSPKAYHYFTNNEDLEEGDRILIRQYQNKEVVVTVLGYSDGFDSANKKLDIIRKVPRTYKKPVRTNKFKSGEKTNMKKANVIKNTKEAMTDAKDVAVKYQKGAAVITAIKSAINESNLVPDSVKKLVNAGNGISDLIIGVVLQVASETFTESEIIQDAAKAANFAGAVSTSIEFTMIQDIIEKVVGNAVGATNMKTAEKAPEVKPSEKDAKK